MGKIISGTAYKSFSAQSTSGISVYSFDFSVSNTSGSAIYLSLINEDGITVCDGIYSNSSRLYDLSDDFYLWGLKKDESVNIKLAISGNKTNYYVNDKYIKNNINVFASRNSITKLYVETTNSSIDLDFSVSGQLPVYSFGDFNFSGNVITGSGYAQNGNLTLPFRIYSGISESGLYSFVNNTTDITGITSFNVIKNFALETEEELSNNITPYEFTIYSNFGIFDTSINVITEYPVIQTLSTIDVTDFSGVSTTGLGSLNWSNYRGASIYNDDLSGRIRITYKSGVSGAAINTLFTGLYSGIGVDSAYVPFVYNPSITGFELNFQTAGIGGYDYKFGRISGSGPTLFDFSYSGYNTSYNYVIRSN
jgi:hypothetical protein